MKVRSVTCFVNPNSDEFDATIHTLANLVEHCRVELKKIGWELQTTRMATTPFGTYTTIKTATHQLKKLEKNISAAGFNYLSIGPARLSFPEEYEIIPSILEETENIFSNAFLAHPQKGISLEAVKACARIITRTSSITPDGFTNLRFCAMSGVGAFTPFFPASYSYGMSPAFSVAVECADAAVQAFEFANSLNDGKGRLISSLDKAAQELLQVFGKAARHFQVEFKGFDFSLAPFPDENCSLGTALESLGILLGNMGSLTAAAILADALDKGNWQRIGFNGLMLPVLEDSRLAERSKDQIFSVKDLLLYSAVCGTGLDTLPLPGDISPKKIEPLLMDLAALSLRLRKPLTARLMPVPGLSVGDNTSFEFAFFHNGRIMDFPARPLKRTVEKI